MKTLLCFGDSNTHGTIPMRTRDEVSRYALGQRWPGVLQAALGADWWVIEEGLPGRTSSFDDPVEGEDRNALRYWQACLQSHRPVDAIVIMLGTNDLKARFMATPSRISQGVATLIDMALDNTPPGGIHPLILVVTPAPIRELGFFQDLHHQTCASAFMNSNFGLTCRVSSDQSQLDCLVSVDKLFFKPAMNSAGVR